MVQLYNDDCLKVLPSIPDKSIDFIFTDLPYGTTQSEWDIRIDLPEMWLQYERVIKDDGVIALWAQSPFDKVLAVSNQKLYRYEWIIEKTQATGFLNANRMPLKAHEQILIFYKKLPTYNPQIEHGYERKVSTAEHKRDCKKAESYGKYGLTDYDSTDRYPRDVLCFKWDKQKCSLHPTQKPLAACEYMIKTYTNEGETVLDTCMGSGSTGVACKNTGRNFIGIELDSNYFDIARKRIDGELEEEDGCLGIVRKDKRNACKTVPLF